MSIRQVNRSRNQIGRRPMCDFAPANLSALFLLRSFENRRYFQNKRGSATKAIEFVDTQKVR